MKSNLWTKSLGLIIFILANISHAGTPLWTFTPLTATTIAIPQGGAATVQYSTE